MNNFLFAWCIAILAGCLCAIQGMTVESRLIVSLIAFLFVCSICVMFSVVRLMKEVKQ